MAAITAVLGSISKLTPNNATRREIAGSSNILITAATRESLLLHKRYMSGKQPASKYFAKLVNSWP